MWYIGISNIYNLFFMEILGILSIFAIFGLYILICSLRKEESYAVETVAGGNSSNRHS